MKKICLVVLLFGVIIINNSCNKIFGVNGTYTIRGRFLKDCNGEPIANYGIRLEQNGGLFSKSRDLAKDTTDANGYYEFTNIPINNKENLEVLHDIKWDQVTNWGGTRGSLGNIKDGDVITWNFYGSYQINVLLKLDIDASSFNPNDTLYIGRDKDNFKILYPIPTKSILTFNRNILVPSLSQLPTGGLFYINWGVGKNFYDSLNKPNTLIDVDNYTLKAKPTICVMPDTSYFTIP